MGKDEETVELIKIFVTSIKTAKKKTEIVVECSVLDVCFSFDVGRSMFDVHLLKQKGCR
ncbi:MAG: hypothetical protein U9N83_20830 [Thermodesulfobacteriota bacterium]|nr:hypothetical protein [Thermodesulfobacteriota bacterium]